MEERFGKYDDDYGKFKMVENKRSNRPDLHAFILLDEICPGTTDLISASEHDKFYLDIDGEKFKEVVTDDQIRELIRCGIMYDVEYECLWMFT